MENWFTDISFLDWCLIGCLGAAFLYELYFYIRYILIVPLYERHRAKRLVGKEQSLPGVSVVLCAHNEAENLEPYLQSLLSQDYPEFEVIVVNDGSEDNTRAVLDKYLRANPKLRVTFVPLEARVRSTKKLGITLAAKAAQYDYLLLTDADCRPESKNWIRAMVSGISDGKDIVLGYGGYFVDKGALNGLIRYDTLFNGLHFLGAAITGRPYMGLGRNLLYRKSFFFESGGFTKQMTTRAGDDDLFVNTFATHKNTSVVASRESVTWSLPKISFVEWVKQKRRHLSVSPKYRLASRLHLGLEPAVRGLFYLLLILIGCFCSVDILVLALGVWLIRLMTQYICINVGALHFGQGRVTLLMMVWDIILPLITLYLLLTKSLYKTNRW